MNNLEDNCSDNHEVLENSASTEVAESPNDAPNPKGSQLLKLNQLKAGLGELDKDRISKVIQEASKGSSYYLHQKARQERIKEQVERHKRALHCITDVQLKAAIEKADFVVTNLEAKRILNKIMVHFDLDMFFAAVEIKKNPQLADKPVAVGSMSMISASNYVARQFGVRSAMAGFIAKKLCPQLILIGGNFREYSRESKFVMDIIAEYDPTMRNYCLDEVKIDLTAYVFGEYAKAHAIDISELYKLSELPNEMWSMAYGIVKQIRTRIFREASLTVSAGIACNTLLAKICSDINKPDGQFMLRGNRFDIIQFVSSLDVSKFPGIGPVNGQILTGLGINNAMDLYSERGKIFSLFSESTASYYLRLSLGIGSSFVSNSDSPQKSHSRERTVGALNKFDDMCLLLEKITRKLSNDLKSHSQQCRTITLKLKKATFESYLKSKSINEYTDDEEIILKVAKELLAIEVAKSPQTTYRLIGVKVSNLIIKDNEATASTSSSSKKQITLSQFVQKEDAAKPAHFITEKSESVDTAVSTIARLNCQYCGKSFDQASEFEFHRSQCEGNSAANLMLDDSDLFEDLESEMGDEVTDQRLNEEDTVECENELQEANSTTADQSEPGHTPSTSTASSETVVCPVCQKNFTFISNEQLNEHIDSCLSNGIVGKISSSLPPSTLKRTSSSEEKKKESEKGKKKQTNKRQKTNDKTNSSSSKAVQLKINQFFIKK